jgi:sterol desaturase/sphingolipid hydroxylase (fatty acid hydroxylase superfamily)
MMPTEPIDVRIRAAFDHNTLEKFGLRYLEAIIGNWRDAEQTMRRLLGFAGVLVVVFFLLLHAKNAEVAFGPLKLTNVAAILTLAPTVVAYLMHEYIDHMGACERYEDACEELVKLLAPSVRENDLDTLLAPEVVHPMGRAADRSWDSLRIAPRPVTREIMRVTQLIGIVVVLFGTLAFLVYAYIYLYGDPHANGTAVSIGLAITVVFTARAVAVFFYI